MQKIATKLTARIAEFVNENKLGISDNYRDTGEVFHYPKHNNHYTWTSKQPSYIEVTENQFIETLCYELIKNNNPLKEVLTSNQMKTKCIVLGQENEPIKELKKIEFVKFIGATRMYNTDNISNQYKNIELISLNYCGSGKDLIFAYNDNRNNGHCYLGHWNDGIA